MRSGLPKLEHKLYIYFTETAVKTAVSSGCRGEDGNRESADAAHFHVASSAFLFLNRISKKLFR